MNRRSPLSAAPFDLDTFLPYRLAIAAESVSHGLATVYEQRFDLTIPEWRVLANLSRHGTLTAGETADRATLDKVQVTRAIQRLHKRRLISRRVDRIDKRRAQLALTAEGERLFCEVAALALAWQQEVLGGLTAPERAAFDRALRHVMIRAMADRAG